MSPHRPARQPPRPPIQQAPVDPEEVARDTRYRAERLARSVATKAVVPGQSSVSELVRAIANGDFRVPPFQRPLVWSDQDILHLLDSLWRGFYVGSILVWESYKIQPHVPVIGGVEAKSAHGVLVVDGQQRLAALHQAFMSHRFSYDSAADKFVVDMPVSPTVFPLHLAIRPSLCPDDESDVFQWIRNGGPIDTVGRISDELVYRLVATVRLPHEWSIANVVEMFRRLNTAGVRMGADEVESALRRAVEGE